MKFTQKLFIFGSLILTASFARATGAEEERLRGFAGHQSNNSKYNSAREKAERAQLEQQEQWEVLRLRNRDAYKKSKKAQQTEISEDGPESRVDAAQKKAWDERASKARESYSALRKNQSMVDRKKNNLPTEAEELDLIDQRPRYDYKKRASFGAAKSGGSRPTTSGSSFGRSNDSGPAFPNPPPFDDFNDSDSSGGYVPPPDLPEDFGDVPPPPPPPPPFDGDSFNSDFPPPPIPNFDADGDF